MVIATLGSWLSAVAVLMMMALEQLQQLVSVEKMTAHQQHVSVAMMMEHQ